MKHPYLKCVQIGILLCYFPLITVFMILSEKANEYFKGKCTLTNKNKDNINRMMVNVKGQ